MQLNIVKSEYHLSLSFIFLGIINYEIKYSGLENKSIKVSCRVEVYDQSGSFIVDSIADSNLSGSISIANASFWWPYLMHKNPGYMYTLKVSNPYLYH